MRNGTFYNQDYFERGIETGKSCYQNYRWEPELTIPMAMTMVDLLSIKKEDLILDYGCAKGYLVKALRLLKRQAWGMDISEYAISCVPTETQEFCKLLEESKPGFPNHYDLCIAKDVFEHIPIGFVGDVLMDIKASKLFAVVPLGDDDRYRAKANNFDQSHVLCKDERWWGALFKSRNWTIDWFDFRVDGIKDSYYATCPKAHGFFIMHR